VYASSKCYCIIVCIKRADLFLLHATFGR
jgi:hypothetical protein